MISLNKISCKKMQEKNPLILLHYLSLDQGLDSMFLIKIETLGACELDPMSLNVVPKEGFTTCS